MHSQVLIILLLETIEALKVAEANKKKKSEMSELIVNAPAAKAKLAAKCGDINKITKNDIFSLLLACFGEVVWESTSKPALVQLFSANFRKIPEAVHIPPVDQV